MTCSGGIAVGVSAFFLGACGTDCLSLVQQYAAEKDNALICDPNATSPCSVARPVVVSLQEGSKITVQSLQRGRTLGLGGLALLLARELIDRGPVDGAQHAHHLRPWRLERGQRHRQRDVVAALVVQHRALGPALLEREPAADAQALVPG